MISHITECVPHGVLIWAEILTHKGDRCGLALRRLGSNVTGSDPLSVLIRRQYFGHCDSVLVYGPSQNKEGFGNRILSILSVLSAAAVSNRCIAIDDPSPVSFHSYFRFPFPFLIGHTYKSLALDCRSGKVSGRVVCINDADVISQDPSLLFRSASSSVTVYVGYNSFFGSICSTASSRSLLLACNIHEAEVSLCAYHLSGCIMRMMVTPAGILHRSLGNLQIERPYVAVVIRRGSRSQTGPMTSMWPMQDQIGESTMLRCAKELLVWHNISRLLFVSDDSSMFDEVKSSFADFCDIVNVQGVAIHSGEIYE